MKKFVLLLVSMVCAMSINAQEAIQKSKFFDNTYVGAQVGVSTPMTFNNFFPVNYNMGVKVGKYLTPAFGLNIEGDMWFGSAADNKSRFSYHNVVRALNVGVNATVDMFNLCGGYKADRFFTIIPEVGLGWLHSFNSNTPDANDLSAKTGVQFAFNVGKDKACQVYVEPTIWWNLTGDYGVQFNKNHSQLALQAGFIYRFKTSNGTHHFVVWNVGDLNKQINGLRSELAKKPKEVIVHDTIVNKVIVRDGYVPFAQNSAEINDSTFLDSIPNTAIVKVYGYASPEGRKEYNQTLSEKRANNVAEYLKKRGVEVREVKGYGANSEYSNRVVIIINE